MSGTTADQPCPECGGAMWDNRDDKRTDKSPDYRCKDQKCGHRVWLTPPKGEQQRASSTPRRSANASRTNARTARSNANEEKDTPDASDDVAQQASKRRSVIASRYQRALQYVFADLAPQFSKHKMTLTDDVTHKMAFEIFKTWEDRGCLL